jgi:hypothetical protein
MMITVTEDRTISCCVYYMTVGSIQHKTSEICNLCSSPNIVVRS